MKTWAPIAAWDCFVIALGLGAPCVTRQRYEARAHSSAPADVSACPPPDSDMYQWYEERDLQDLVGDVLRGLFVGGQPLRLARDAMADGDGALRFVMAADIVDPAVATARERPQIDTFDLLAYVLQFVRDQFHHVRRHEQRRVHHQRAVLVMRHHRA